MLFRWVLNAYSLQRSQTTEDVISLTHFWKSRVFPSLLLLYYFSMRPSLSSFSTFFVNPSRATVSNGSSVGKKKKKKGKTDAVHKLQVMLCVFLTVLFLLFFIIYIGR